MIENHQEVFTRLIKMEGKYRKPREIFECRLLQNKKDVKGMNI